MRDFAPHQQALELRELGFDEPCLGYYLCRNSAFGIDDLLITTEWIDLLPYDSSSCKAPTYSQAFTWFREKYQIDSWIYPNLNGLYSVSIVRRGVGLGKVSEYQTYPEAELDCLIKLIEITKTK
jgi:hypothetical protein